MPIPETWLALTPAQAAVVLARVKVAALEKRAAGLGDLVQSGVDGAKSLGSSVATGAKELWKDPGAYASKNPLHVAGLGAGVGALAGGLGAAYSAEQDPEKRRSPWLSGISGALSGGALGLGLGAGYAAMNGPKAAPGTSASERLAAEEAAAAASRGPGKKFIDKAFRGDPSVTESYPNLVFGMADQGAGAAKGMISSGTESLFNGEANPLLKNNVPEIAGVGLGAGLGAGSAYRDFTPNQTRYDDYVTGGSKDTAGKPVVTKPPGTSSADKVSKANEAVIRAQQNLDAFNANREVSGTPVSAAPKTKLEQALAAAQREHAYFSSSHTASTSNQAKIDAASQARLARDNSISDAATISKAQGGRRVKELINTGTYYDPVGAAIPDPSIFQRSRFGRWSGHTFKSDNPDLVRRVADGAKARGSGPVNGRSPVGRAVVGGVAGAVLPSIIEGVGNAWNQYRNPPTK
jgi:hypothetical protein